MAHLGLFVLQLFELEQDVSQVAAQLRLGCANLLGGLGQEGAATTGMVQVEGVDVEAVAARIEDHQVDFHDATDRIAIQATNSPTTRFDGDGGFGVGGFDVEFIDDGGNWRGSRLSFGLSETGRLGSRVLRRLVRWIECSVVLSCFKVVRVLYFCTLIEVLARRAGHGVPRRRCRHSARSE